MMVNAAAPVSGGASWPATGPQQADGECVAVEILPIAPRKGAH